MRIRVYGSAQALYCVANTLYWKSFKRQIFTHLTVLKHQNTKTSLFELPKNHWVFALFEIFRPARKRLQSTVFNDHPVFDSYSISNVGQCRYLKFRAQLIIRQRSQCPKLIMPKQTLTRQLHTINMGEALSFKSEITVEC